MTCGCATSCTAPPSGTTDELVAKKGFLGDGVEIVHGANSLCWILPPSYADPPQKVSTIDFVGKVGKKMGRKKKGKNLLLAPRNGVLELHQERSQLLF
jgi:hypothetical protein